MRLKEEELRGRVVISADGQAVGEITGFALDTLSWRVEGLQVKLRREAADRVGARRSVFHASELELPSGLVQSVGDAIVLSVPLEGLRSFLPAEEGEVPRV